MSKSVNIPQELFFELIRYFYLEDVSESRYKAIREALELKLDNLVKHELYTTYKTAESPQEREEARQKYLDTVGIRDSFRWSAEYDRARKS